MSTICIAENSGGKGGVAGGAGAHGQASQQATGHGASDYGYPVIECVTGMTAEFDVQLTRDYAGEIPSDLSDVTSVVFAARPTMRHGSDREFRVPCEFSADGKVRLKLTPKQVNHNEGVWYAEFLCYRENGELPQDYRAYLCIRKGMDGSSSGPLSDRMILNAVERAIDEWEETPPTLTRHFNATNFPFREALIKGAVGYLLQSVMYRYMRNRMQYSASGLTFDRNDKGAQYQTLAAQAREEWRMFVNAKKTSMNMDECFGVLEAPWFDDRGVWY